MDEVSPQMKDVFNYSSFRSGFLKLSVMRLLSVRPMHGYALMKEIERLSEHTWKPSPGSIYPALQELQRSGLIVLEVRGRKRIYQITPAGKIVLDEAMDHIRMGIVNLQHLLDYSSDGET